MTTAASPLPEAGEPGESFPRQARLLTPKDFSTVFEKRTARRGRFFCLHVGPRPEPVGSEGDASTAPAAKTARLGITVAKKFLRTAVHRNVLKRLARESFRRMRASLEPRDYVVRLAIKLDPRRTPLDRRALTGDLVGLFKQYRRKSPASAESSC